MKRIFTAVAAIIAIIVVGCTSDSTYERFKPIDTGLFGGLYCDTKENVSYLRNHNGGVTVLFARDGRPLPCDSITQGGNK